MLLLKICKHLLLIREQRENSRERLISYLVVGVCETEKLFTLSFLIKPCGRSVSDDNGSHILGSLPVDCQKRERVSSFSVKHTPAVVRQPQKPSCFSQNEKSKRNRRLTLLDSERVIGCERRKGRRRTESVCLPFGSIKEKERRRCETNKFKGFHFPTNQKS